MNPGRKNPKVIYPAGPVDPSVHFLMFRPEGQNEFIASFTVFSSHYVRGGTEFSADYPYFMQERYKEIFGDKILSVFGLGPCGNVSTVDINSSSAENETEKVKRIGSRLADEVQRALPDGKKGNPDFAVNSRVIYLPMQGYTETELRWSKEGTQPMYRERDFLETRRKLKISIWGVQPPLELLRLNEAVAPAVSGDPWRLPVEIHAFRLDSRTAIVTMPGELFVEFGIDLKKRSPFPNTMLVELANADIAYIPTEQGFKEGDYEAVNSRLAPGSGEKMVEAALQMLQDLKDSMP
jgi:hypothetical protein